MRFVYTDNHGLHTEYNYLLDNILGFSIITYFISMVNMFGIFEADQPQSYSHSCWQNFWDSHSTVSRIYIMM